MSTEPQTTAFPKTDERRNAVALTEDSPIPTADGESASRTAEADAPRILLHACCGPCSLEPSRLLIEQGWKPTIYFANSNIEPADEYARRLRTLQKWAQSSGLPVVEGAYDNASWQKAIASSTGKARAERCRACYRQRFGETARYAVEHGFATIGTTLSVSPYQHTAIIAEELQRAAREAGIGALFQDYRPNYPQATQRSRDLGMYRQNYCGCAQSIAEAARDRAERREARAATRADRERLQAQKMAEQKAAHAQKRAEKQAYEQERARRRMILKQMREQTRTDVANTAKAAESTDIV